MEKKKKRWVDEKSLREMGVPENVIKEAKRAEETGLFDMEPSPDLVERTFERTRHLLPPRPSLIKRILACISKQFKKRR